jgi:hypothetical protein
MGKGCNIQRRNLRTRILYGDLKERGHKMESNIKIVFKKMDWEGVE